jgi:hypothetical protein
MKEDVTVQKSIMNGVRPPMQPEIRNSTDPFVIAMIEAISMCWKQDPNERASAREVQNFLDGELKRLGVHESGTKKDLI